MINGIFEHLRTSWKDRIGDGMEIEDGIITFKHKKKKKNTLVTTLFKNKKPFQIDTYETYASGMLKKLTHQKIGKKPHWIYEYSIVEDLLKISRTNSNGEKISYSMDIIKSDNKGRIITAEYRLVDTDEHFGTIKCKRDKKGRLIKEKFMYEQEKRVDYLDKKGRYLKMEFYDEDNLIRTVNYIH